VAAAERRRDAAVAAAVVDVHQWKSFDAAHFALVQALLTALDHPSDAAPTLLALSRARAAALEMMAGTRALRSGARPWRLVCSVRVRVVWSGAIGQAMIVVGRKAALPLGGGGRTRWWHSGVE